MSKTMITAAGLLLALSLAGCSTGAAPDPDSGGQDSAPSAVASDADRLLAPYGLDGVDAVTIIDQLDRLGSDARPADLRASVLPGELVVSAGDEEYRLDLPSDQFYLSTAPYVDATHECFHHSLTTCMGELGSIRVHVRIVDQTNGEVLVDETTSTFANGFIGYWLPRDIEGTLELTYDGKSGATEFTTDAAAPTCISTLRLV